MALPGAVDRDLWRALGDIGVFALTVPEADRAASASGWPRPRWCSRSWGGPLSPGRSWARSWPPGLPLGPVAGAALAGEAVVGLHPEGRPPWSSTARPSTRCWSSSPAASC